MRGAQKSTREYFMLLKRNVDTNKKKEHELHVAGWKTTITNNEGTHTDMSLMMITCPNSNCALKNKSFQTRKLAYFDQGAIATTCCCCLAFIGKWYHSPYHHPIEQWSNDTVGFIIIMPFPFRSNCGYFIRPNNEKIYPTKTTMKIAREKKKKNGMRCPTMMMTVMMVAP